MLGFLLARPRVEKVAWAHTCTGWAWLHPTLLSRLPRETLAVREELDALKFLCKDLWAATFQKHMDGLRTNHQVGVRAGPAQPQRLASRLEAVEALQGNITAGTLGTGEARASLEPLREARAAVGWVAGLFLQL